MRLGSFGLGKAVMHFLAGCEAISRAILLQGKEQRIVIKLTTNHTLEDIECCHCDSSDPIDDKEML